MDEGAKVGIVGGAAMGIFLFTILKMGGNISHSWWWLVIPVAIILIIIDSEL
jgi:hypothetical protein